MKSICIGLIFLCTSCEDLEKIQQNYPSDNIIEKAIENIIQQKTGLDIDLSPCTPETV